MEDKNWNYYCPLKINGYEKDGADKTVNAYTQGQNSNRDGMADDMANNVVEYLDNMCNRNNMHAYLVAKYVSYNL